MEDFKVTHYHTTTLKLLKTVEKNKPPITLKQK